MRVRSCSKVKNGPLRVVLYPKRVGNSNSKRTHRLGLRRILHPQLEPCLKSQLTELHRSETIAVLYQHHALLRRMPHQLTEHSVNRTSGGFDSLIWRSLAPVQQADQFRFSLLAQVVHSQPCQTLDTVDQFTEIVLTGHTTISMRLENLLFLSRQCLFEVLRDLVPEL